MSRSRRKSFSLGLGAEDMTVVDLATRRPLTSLPLAAYVPGVAHIAHADWQPLIAALVAQADLADGADLQVTVSDVWSRSWMFSVPVGVNTLDELQALAAARFEALFGIAPEGWQLMADWKASGDIMACALPMRLLEALQSEAGQKGWRVRSIQPSLVRLLGAWMKQIPDDAWVACYGLHSMTLVRVAEGEVRHIRRHPFLVPPDASVLQSLVEVEMLRLGQVAPEALCVLGMTPSFDAGVKVAGMRLIQARRGGTSPGTLSESLMLGLQGIAE